MIILNLNVLVFVGLLLIQCRAHVVKHVIEEADRRVKGLANVVTSTLFGGIKVGFSGHVSTSADSSETVNEPPPRRPGLFGSLFQRPEPPPRYPQQDAGPEITRPPGGRPAFGNHNHGGYNQGGYIQGGYNQGGYNQGEPSQGEYNQGVLHQNGNNQGGYNQGGYIQGGYNQGGYNQGGYSQGGYNQGGYSQGGNNQGENGNLVPTTIPIENYQNNQEHPNLENNPQGHPFSHHPTDSNEIKKTSTQPAVDLTTKATPAPKKEEEKPIFVALNPGEYVYGGEDIKIQKPVSDQSDEFEIDVRAKDDDDEMKETKNL